MPISSMALTMAAAFLGGTPLASAFTSSTASSHRTIHPARHVQRVQHDAIGAPSRTRSGITRLDLFGNLFGNDQVDEDREGLSEGDLARFSHLVPSDANLDTKFDSLSIMISEWGKLFDPEGENGGKGTGLTTPVSVVMLPRTDSSSGVRLLFRRTKTGYKDKDEKKDGDGTKSKEDATSEGGVEVIVTRDDDEDAELTVLARRCEIEEGTMIKEMSEQTIVDSLRKAMAAWKKEQG
jgi:hypothetical protein